MQGVTNIASTVDNHKKKYRSKYFRKLHNHYKRRFNVAGPRVGIVRNNTRIAVEDVERGILER